ncbi:DUF4181 domain-containing protein [Guptibacillus hwajinpoensis]|uniref:DUF4181 domain-containing protein n=1 Tax=Guptibacillus hwajinpoensis TaxID=208199 RepID=UPI001CFEA64C|nr:DUF4181 domain-containing protein [Pseudalkalibacillus hwajinpoensis]WLR61902.1 DUF4181 domain-containing protein [Pseudalkalibacillus hwajinpoensis]
MIFITILGVVLFSFNAIMRRLLKVEKKKLFSNNYLNDTHKKVDQSMRVTVIILLIISYLYNVTRPSTEWVWFWQPWFLMCLMVIITELTTALMEWKYATNRKDYLLTISQLLFFIIVMATMFSSNFFGLM